MHAICFPDSLACSLAQNRFSVLASVIQSLVRVISGEQVIIVAERVKLVCLAYLNMPLASTVFKILSLMRCWIVTGLLLQRPASQSAGKYSLCIGVLETDRHKSGWGLGTFLVWVWVVLLPPPPLFFSKNNLINRNVHTQIPLEAILPKSYGIHRA